MTKRSTEAHRATTSARWGVWLARLSWLGVVAPIVACWFAISRAPEPVELTRELTSEGERFGLPLIEVNRAWSRWTRSTRTWEARGARDFPDSEWSQFDHSRNSARAHAVRDGERLDVSAGTLWLLYDTALREGWSGASSLRNSPVPLAPRSH